MPPSLGLVRGDQKRRQEHHRSKEELLGGGELVVNGLIAQVKAREFGVQKAGK